MNTAFAGYQGAMMVPILNDAFKNSILYHTHYVFRGKVNHKKDSYILEQPQMYTMARYNEVKGQLMPIYPLTKGLSNKTVVKAVTQALDKYKIGLEKEYIPEYIRENV